MHCDEHKHASICLFCQVYSWRNSVSWRIYSFQDLKIYLPPQAAVSVSHWCLFSITFPNWWRSLKVHLHHTTCMLRFIWQLTMHHLPCIWIVPDSVTEQAVFWKSRFWITHSQWSTYCNSQLVLICCEKSDCRRMSHSFISLTFTKQQRWNGCLYHILKTAHPIVLFLGSFLQFCEIFF